MRISDLMRLGLRNLSRRKARTALTVVGVIIGTISIVVMVSIGIGMNTNFTKMIMEQGSLNVITVNKNSYQTNENGEYNSFIQKLDDKTVESIRNMEHVKVVLPVYSCGVTITCRDYETGREVYATDLTLLKDFSFPKLKNGDYPTEKGSETLIFGSDTLTYMYHTTNWRAPSFSPDLTKDKLFYRLNSWEYQQDHTKKIKQKLIREPLLMETTGSNEGYDWSIYMDMDIFKKEYTEYVKKYIKKVDQKKALKILSEYNQIKILVDNVKYVTSVQDQIKEMGLLPSSLASVIEPMQQTSKMLQMVLGGVGAVAMIVSAISIANTMIMSIYERTKEIGVMKVLGCVITDIKKLFLFEAGTIGLIGGAIGVGMSYVASYFINKFGEPLFVALMKAGGTDYVPTDGTSFSMIPFWLPLAATAFAIFIGIISGYYPASRATKISAIEAMKSDG